MSISAVIGLSGAEKQSKRRNKMVANVTHKRIGGGVTSAEGSNANNSINSREPAALVGEMRSEHKRVSRSRFGRSTSAAGSRSTNRKSKCVSISDEVQTIEIPVDQDTSVRVWTVYSPVFYVSRDEQQRIRRQCEVRAQKLRKLCSLMLDMSLKGDTGRLHTNYSTYLRGIFHVGPRINRAPKSSAAADKDMHETGYSSHLSAVLCFVLSAHSSAPISAFPMLSVPVERAFSSLFTTVRLCIFRDVPATPQCCMAALRMLRNADSEEGSIAVYSTHDRGELQAYIPLSAIDAVSCGLQQEERQTYVDKDGYFKCTDTADQVELAVRGALAFTLHCYIGRGFYVSFAALEQHVYTTWLTVLSYIVDANNKCRSYGK